MATGKRQSNRLKNRWTYIVFSITKMWLGREGWRKTSMVMGKEKKGGRSKKGWVNIHLEVLGPSGTDLTPSSSFIFTPKGISNGVP
jgi:hypothetical protein